MNIELICTTCGEQDTAEADQTAAPECPSCHNQMVQDEPTRKDRPMKTELRDIDITPEWRGMFDVAISITTEQIKPDSGQQFVAEMLQYGKRLCDVKPKQPEWASVAWSPDDLRRRSNTTVEQAGDLLEKIEDEIQVAMIEAGWSVIEKHLTVDGA